MIVLSVCIPAYNAADVVERAIRSIVTDEIDGDVEILVCDDGSTDATWDRLMAVKESVDGVRLLRNAHNEGRPRTRNRLLHEARGTYLTWLDADDEKQPGMLAAQLAHLQRIEARTGDTDGVFVFTNYDWLRTGWTRPKKMCPEPPSDPLRSLLDASFGGYLWLMMGLRTTFLKVGDFDAELPRLQDLDFFIRFAERGGRFERVEDERSLCVYHKDDAGRSAMDVWRAWTRIWRKHHHHFVSYGLVNARAWRRHHYRVARRYARANNDKLAYGWIAALEVAYLVRGRLRRVVFDA